MRNMCLSVILSVMFVMLVACGGEAPRVNYVYDAQYYILTYPGEPMRAYECETAHLDEVYESYIEHLDEQQCEAELPPGFYNFFADALLFIETIEAVHPIFILDGMLPEYYEAFRDEFLSKAAVPITRSDFVLAMQRFSTVLRDGHMGMGVYTDRRLGGRFSHGGGIHANFVMRDGRFFLDSEPDVELLKIAGVPIDDIVYQIDRYFFFENQLARNHHMPSLLGNEVMWRRAGGNTSRWTVELTLLENNVEILRNSTIFGQATGASWPQFNYIIRFEVLEEHDIFHIALRQFIDGDHITEVVNAIKEAMEAGIRHFIVDLRGNRGGNSWAGQRLLEAMGITLPSFGAVRRASEMAMEQRGVSFPPDADRIVFQPFAASARNPNNVHVSVLTDVYTFSSATMMAVWVQDGGFGSVIGEPSSNSPSAFGDMLNFELPIARLGVNVSYTRFLRPNPDADQETLWPDIIMPARDAFYVAVEYLRNR